VSAAPAHCEPAEGTAPYEMVVGVEVHAQLRTRTKLFCGCETAFGAAPNTRTCPVCLGLPGALPVLNREAFELCLKAALALGCEVDETTRFDRKNYYYPDQPRNYQISQSYAPIGRGGSLELLGSRRRISIDNVHLEDDAGKLVHDGPGAEGGSLVDLNRAGTPLAEIVSGPDLRSIDEVQDYMETLRRTLVHLGLSRGRMEEGNLRFEASISLRPWGQDAFGERVEVKNLNSLKAVRAALAFETRRQTRVLDAGGAVSQETRLWDEARGETRRMRSKEDAQDYRYFPEPDLPPVRIDAGWRERARAALGELPTARQRRYRDKLGLGEYEIGVLLQDPVLSAYFDRAVALGDAKTAANWVLNDLLAQLKHRDLAIGSCPVPPGELMALAGLVKVGTVSGQAARQIALPAMFDEGLGAEAAVAAKGLAQESDEAKLGEIVATVVAAHPGPVEQYLAGKTKVLGFLVGQCMRASRGKGNPKVFQELLRNALAP